MTSGNLAKFVVFHIDQTVENRKMSVPRLIHGKSFVQFTCDLTGVEQFGLKTRFLLVVLDSAKAADE